MNKKDFPILKEIIYLDSAAGCLKPVQVVEAIKNFYYNFPINPHSENSELGQKVIKRIDNCRQLVANLIESNSNNVIFTSGTTDSINKIALSLMNILKEGDEILLSYYNHISNVIPWFKIAELTKSKVVFSTQFSEINSKTKIVALAQINNSINIKLDLQRIYQRCKAVDAILINDAAQAINEGNVTFKQADVIVFSGNKLFGPTGIGVLAIKEPLLSQITPFLGGGGALANISVNGKYCFKKGYWGFEGGTPNTSGIIGLEAAIKYFNKHKNLTKLKELSHYAYEQLKKIPNVVIHSQKGDKNIIFNIENHNAQDIVSFLGHKKIYLRAGDHCAKNICEIKEGFGSNIRMSLSFYNDFADIDKTILTIKKGGDFLDFI